MTAAIRHLPNMVTRMDRVTQAERAANIARDLEDARFMLANPTLFNDAALRWSCSILETYGNGSDYLLADQMIHALNLKERQDAHATVRRRFVEGYQPDRPKPADNGLRNVAALLCFVGMAGVLIGFVVTQGWQ